MTGELCLTAPNLGTLRPQDPESSIQERLSLLSWLPQNIAFVEPRREMTAVSTSGGIPLKQKSYLESARRHTNLLPTSVTLSLGDNSEAHHLLECSLEVVQTRLVVKAGGEREAQ